MTSKRTISYIGLWALIMPWLGFSWETKTILFSLTGILLLIIGNRQYYNEKKLQKLKANTHNNNHNNHNEINNTPTVPIDNEFNHSINNAVPYVPKQRIKREVEITRPVRKIAMKSTNEINNEKE